MRYFINRFPDILPGMKVDIYEGIIVDKIVKLSNDIIKNAPPTVRNCDGGLYVGCAGIAYAFHYLSKAHSHSLSSLNNSLFVKAKEYVEASLQFVDSKSCRDPPTSFLLGKAGIYMVASLVYASLKDEHRALELRNRYLELASIVLPRDFLRSGSDELFVGRAGYLCGLLMLSRQYGDKIFSQANSNSICTAIVESGRHYAQRHKSRCPLMYAYYDTEYLGAAHGLSSILQMLLSFPSYIQSDPQAEADIRQSVDFIISTIMPNGNVAPAMDEVSGSYQRPASEELVHWCHGAPGVVYLMARSYLVWKDAKYLTVCEKFADLTWEKGLLRKGPGICHGVAGNGYVFLLLYRLTHNDLYLHRALKFAEFLNMEEFKEARVPDDPYSLYEGWAGTLCFLVDLLQPDKAEFPFFDVFYS